MNHYRCVECYFPRTKTTRDYDTVTFFPTTIPFPEVKLQYYLRQATSDIISILTLSPSTTTPSLESGDPVWNTLVTLAIQLKRIDHIPDKLPIYDAASPRVETTVLPKHYSPPAEFSRVVPQMALTPWSPPGLVLLEHSK